MRKVSSLFKFSFGLFWFGVVMVFWVAPVNALLAQNLDKYNYQAQDSQRSRIIYRNEEARYSRDSLGMFVNDTLWDGEDRWRTGSYQKSFYFSQFLNEFRFRTEYLSPLTLDHPNKSKDRPYVSLVNLYWGQNRQFNDNVLSYGASADFYNLLGTGLDFHEFIHNLTGFGKVNLNGHILDGGARLNVESAFRKDMKTQYGYAIPFVEAHLGSRNLVTAGVDVVLTRFKYDFYSREQTTGNLIARVRTHPKPGHYGYDFIFGGDVSYIWSDQFIEGNPSKVTLEPFRYRIRSGARIQYGDATLFIGPTYLSPEFKEQSEGQIVQAISFQYNF